jgi:glycosyltransferase involved in cell wall biosynthesis
MISICFFVRKLELGGAERQLVALAKGLPKDKFATSVLTFYPGGELEQELIDAGISVTCLNKSGRFDLFGFELRLISHLRRFQPNIVHAFQGPPNILCQIAKAFAPNTKVIWGIRQSRMDLSNYDYSRRLVLTASRWLSKYADLIIANSHAGLDYLTSSGIGMSRTVVICNGIDTQRFRPIVKSRTDIRQHWNILDGVPAIGMVARFDRKKNHELFLQAAAVLANRYQTARFVFVGGGGSPDYLGSLKSRATQLNIADKIVWAGLHMEVETAMNGLDINTLCSSYGEGFPNSVGEAMSCGVPCVVTDCGDSSFIVDDKTKVINANNPDDLATAWAKILELSPTKMQELSVQTRERIEQNFSLSIMLDKSAKTYTQILA